MGVKGLNNFITRFEKNIIDRIDMHDEIENWKIDNNGKVPQILIDLKEVAHIFVQRDEIGVILGGRFDYYNKMLRNFLENLKKTNVKLVFFMAGTKYTDDLQFFIPKRESEYMNCLTIFDKLESKSDLKAYLDEKNKFSTDIRMSLAFDYNLKKLVRRYGDFYVNLFRHNQEIARYAKQHADEVLAIISNDTDFMAFEGDFQFWRANGINIKTLTGIRYCRHKLLEKLQLNIYQMPLLSALCGSNFLPYYVIGDWINKLVASNTTENRGKIWNVSMYVKRQPMGMVKNKPNFDLERISCDIFGPDCTPEQLNSIENGLNCYDINFNDEPEPKMSFWKFCKKHDAFMYKLVVDDIFNVKDVEFIDFRNYKSKSYTELVVPILMKLCGILLKDHARRRDTRKICIKHAHDEPFKVTEEKIIYPPMKLPELFDLIFKNKERNFDKSRWNLLNWVLDLDDDFPKKFLEKKEFMVVILTLKYLVQQEELTAKQANAILYTEHKIRNLGSAKIDYPQTPNADYVRIAHLYVKIYVLISHCLDVCGLHEMTDLIRFEGPLFHKTMEKFDISNDSQMRVLHSSIESIFIFS
ncbi:uncharacterized protein LOC116352656 [Contarinia nasturtii]|uniref:uncharacterized protein LOC116352656 n=1 Tax=Contarinia nasturtii TaxID=265458 RepID=UPI0012D4094E|nr:uncharacterized protein LOC116352656 [Contarinia nasturtii]